MAGESGGWASAAGAASAGAIVVQLTLNTGGLQKGLDDANKSLKTIGQQAESAFKTAGGALGSFGERIGNVGKSLKKMFGDDAPRVMQDFRGEVQKSLGLTDAQVKGLGQSVEALEGAFKLAGQAVQFLISPMGIALAMGMSLVAVFGAVRNAMGAAGKSGGGGNGWFSSLNDTLTEWVPGAKMANRAWEGAKGWWNESASTPGTIAETISKMDPLKDLMDGFKSGLEGIPGLLDGFKKMLGAFSNPGVTKSDKAKAERALDKEMKDAVDYLDDLLVENAKDFVQKQKDVIEFNQMFVDTAEWNAEERKKQEEELARTLREINDNEVANIEAEYSKMRSRWGAVASGQFGTAFGMNGTAGAAFNIAGGALANAGPNTSAALQGASTGGQAGGPWGAVIGAIVALAMRTQTLSKLFGIIENVLGAILPVLDQVLRPVLLSLEPPLKMLGEVLGIVGKVFELFNNLLKPLEQLNEGMLSLFDCIGNLVDAIGDVASGATSMMDTKFGADSQGRGGTSINDITGWLTLGNVFGGIANEIEGKDFLTGKEKNPYKPKAFEEQLNYNAQSIGQMGEQVKQFGFAAEAAKDPIFQLVEAQLYAAQSLNDMATSTRQAEYGLAFLSDPNNQQALYDDYEARRNFQRAQEEQNKAFEERYAADYGLAEVTNRAADAVAKWTDALINATPGFKLAAAVYGASAGGGPGAGTTQSLSTGGGGVHVYVDGAEVAAAVERRGDRRGMLAAAPLGSM